MVMRASPRDGTLSLGTYPIHSYLNCREYPTEHSEAKMIHLKPVPTSILKRLLVCVILLAGLPRVELWGQGPPELLRLTKGIKVKTMDEWERIRRPEILELFRSTMYGHSPGKPDAFSFRLLSSDDAALRRKATRKQVRVYFDADTTVRMD